MLTDDQLTRNIHYEYREQQRKQIRLRIRRKTKKESKRRLILECFIDIMAFIVLSIACIALISLDVWPLKSGLILMLSTVLLAVYGAYRGALRW